MAQAIAPATWEAEAQGFLEQMSLSPAWATVFLQFACIPLLKVLFPSLLHD